MSTTRPTGDAPGDHGHGGDCLFGWAEGRHEHKQVFIDTSTVAEAVLRDVCYHADVDPAGIPLPPTGIAADIEHCDGAMPFPTGNEALDTTMWAVTSDHAATQLGRATHRANNARNDVIGVIDCLELVNASQFFAKTTLNWTLRRTGKPHLVDLIAGRPFLMVDAPHEPTSWHAWIVTTSGSPQQHGTLDAPLNERLRSIWRSIQANP